MAFLPLDIKAGIKDNIDYQNKGNWIDADLVRFENGFLTNIGGWKKIKQTALDGTLFQLLLTPLIILNLF